MASMRNDGDCTLRCAGDGINPCSCWLNVSKFGLLSRMPGEMPHPLRATIEAVAQYPETVWTMRVL
jgi:hypothetical protein